MISIDIPGRSSLSIGHVVCDYNGTIAVDGELIAGVAEHVAALLAAGVRVYVLTADTYGTVRQQCASLGAEVRTFPREGAAACKREIVEGLGAGVACLGNGFNDIQMFDACDLSIAILEREGACASLLMHADVAVCCVDDAFDLLLKPNRLKATLRS